MKSHYKVNTIGGQSYIVESDINNPVEFLKDIYEGVEGIGYQFKIVTDNIYYKTTDVFIPIHNIDSIEWKDISKGSRKK